MKQTYFNWLHEKTLKFNKLNNSKLNFISKDCLLNHWSIVNPNRFFIILNNTNNFFSVKDIREFLNSLDRDRAYGVNFLIGVGKGEKIFNLNNDNLLIIKDSNPNLLYSYVLTDLARSKLYTQYEVLTLCFVFVPLVIKESYIIRYYYIKMKKKYL